MAVITQDRFDRLSIGMCASLLRTVQEEDLLASTRLSGDNNPIHLSDQYAASIGFPSRVAHGFFTASLISTLLGMQMPGPGTIFLKQTLCFLGPVLIGDIVRAQIEIIELDREKRRVRLRSVCWVESKQVLEGEALVKVPEQIDGPVN